MADEPKDLDIGQIRFLDNSIPTLEAGVYNLGVTQKVKETTYKIDANYQEDQKIVVQAPRFSLPATAIHSKFPAAGSTGDFSQSLPFVTFESENLPWMRTLENGDASGYQAPWMAVMLFEEDELIYTAPAQGNASKTRATYHPIAEVINPPSGISGPGITLDPIEQANTALSAYTIDVSSETFSALAPQVDELPFLAHLREINAGNDAIDGMTGVGKYPVVICNRLPEPDKSYIVHLVSLEGYGDHLPGPNNKITETNTLRLVSLLSWNFKTTAASANFTALVDDLDKGLMNLNFEAPAAWGDDLTDAQKEIKNRYQEGYVAVNNVTRLGESTFSWYRGPLVPVLPQHITNTDPNSEQALLTSDQALLYDASTGLFDQSFAAAWETGRMVTLADRTVSKAVYDWKKDGVDLLKLVDTLLAEDKKKGTSGASLSSSSSAALKTRVVDSKSAEPKLMNYLAGSLGQRLAAHKTDPTQAVVPVKHHSDLHRKLDTMPGLIDPDAPASLSEGEDDPHQRIANLLNSSSSKKN